MTGSYPRTTLSYPQPSRWLFICLLLLLCFTATPQTFAQSPTQTVSNTLQATQSQTQQALDTLADRIKRVEKEHSGEDKPSDELNWLYQARDFHKKTLASIERSRNYLKAIQEAPAQLKQIEQELAKPLPAAAKIDEREPLNKLAQQLESARSELEEARKLRNATENEMTRRSERLQQLSSETNSARQRLQELESLLAPLATGDKERLESGRKTATQAESNYLNQSLLELEQEQRSYEQRRELLRAKRQQAERRLLISEQYFSTLEKTLNQRRTSAAVEVMQAADSALQAATSAHPLVRAIVDQNQQLASELTQVSAQSAGVSEERKQLETTLERIQRQYEGIKEKIAQIGLTDAIGLKLRNDRNQLPDPALLDSSLSMRRAEVNRVQLRRIEIEDKLLALVDLKHTAQQLAASAGPLTEAKQQALQNALLYALKEQKENYLDELIKAYDIYFEKQLFPTMEAERALVALITDYSAFIDSRILWIQSTAPVSANDLSRLGQAVAWLLDPMSIGQLLAALADDLQHNPLVVIVPLLLIGALIFSYGRLKALLSELGRYVTKLSKAKFSDTLLATAITILMTVPWPMLLHLCAWRLELSSPDNSYAGAVAAGLYSVAYLLFGGLLVRRLTRPDGVGESHFRWRPKHLTLVRRHLSWFLPTAAPLTFVIAATLNQPTQAYHDSLGRLAFVLLMVVTSVMIYQLLRPSAGLLQESMEKRPGGWLERLSGLWFPALLISPIALAVAAMAGYFYTAIQLCLYGVATLALIFSINLVRAFFIRGLNIAQRKLLLEQWRKKFEAQAEGNHTHEAVESSETLAHEEPQLDVDLLSNQTKKLLDSAYWIAIIIATALIWSDVLPALNLLNEVVLWQSEVSNAEGANPVSTMVPTTLANLMLAFVVLIMTFFVSRNIPGLLEIAILQRLPFTPGGRYAITTVTRYVIIIVGLAMSFNAIGIGWSKVQWLAAAVTVGLGFGLQEIFANFVSGLIILFERQIRVGDAVTVGGISGKVARIQMRATTITDWDRKELVIPNKEFVTGQVINWSLSDTILRLTVQVGIAYGSDTQLAYDTLLAVAYDDHNVLDEPEPTVRFSSFGESSLDFELRVFIPNPDLLLEVRHDLHMEIDRRFRKAGIEIAFPQRDIHIRDVPHNLFTNKPNTGTE